MVHAAGVLQDGLILPNLPKASKTGGKMGFNKKCQNINPPVTVGIQSPCQRLIGVYNHLKRRSIWVPCSHPQKVIGFQG